MNTLKNIVLSFLFFIPLIGISQNLYNLDVKYGFNKFKLESSIQTYDKSLKFVYHDEKTGVKFYKYIKKDISVFGYSDIEEIGLGFYKGKLYTISIEMNPYGNDEMYKTILTKLKDLFGYPSVVSSGRDYGEWDSRSYMENVNQWNSGKTLLGLNKVKCSSPITPCKLSIFLVSNVVQRQIDSDGF